MENTVCQLMAQPSNAQGDHAPKILFLADLQFFLSPTNKRAIEGRARIFRRGGHAYRASV